MIYLIIGGSCLFVFCLYLFLLIKCGKKTRAIYHVYKNNRLIADVHAFNYQDAEREAQDTTGKVDIEVRRAK